MSKFTIDITCPHCGSDMELVNQGTLAPIEQRAIMQCTNRKCYKQSLLQMQFVPVNRVKEELRMNQRLRKLRNAG